MVQNVHGIVWILFLFHSLPKLHFFTPHMTNLMQERVELLNEQQKIY